MFSFLLNRDIKKLSFSKNFCFPVNVKETNNREKLAVLRSAVFIDYFIEKYLQIINTSTNISL